MGQSGPDIIAWLDIENEINNCSAKCIKKNANQKVQINKNKNKGKFHCHCQFIVRFKSFILAFAAG